MAQVMFDVAVPAKLMTIKKDALGTSILTQDDQSIQYAKQVRDFIVKDERCQFYAEVPHLNGKAWWVSFKFTTAAGTAEAVLSTLQTEIGVGGEKGHGTVLVLPVELMKVGSTPKVCGRPRDMPFHVSPYGINNVISPKNTTFSPERKTTIEEREDSLRKRIIDDEEEDEGMEIEIEEDRVKKELEEQFKNLKEKKRESKVKKYAGAFTETIRSRVAVEAVRQLVEESAKFSFDYVMLTIIASIIACTGLVTNNVVAIVASMLVSPLMGPILSVTFGFVIGDKDLVKQGLFSELMGLLMCIIVGYIGGLCSAPVNGLTWPTEEMASRAQPRGMLPGLAIAIASGVGVALSVLSNNTSSLVGVAISASLLPPAVNSGILLAAASFAETPYTNFTFPDVHPKWPKDETGILLYGAAFSFALTVMNIVVIWICGILMFKFKEVSSDSSFWKEDIRNARRFNKVVNRSGKIASLYRRQFDKAYQKMNPKWTDLGAFRSNGVRQRKHPPAPAQDNDFSLQKTTLNEESGAIQFAESVGTDLEAADSGEKKHDQVEVTPKLDGESSASGDIELGKIKNV